MAAYPLTFQVHDWSVSLGCPTGFKISAVDTDPVKPVQDLCSVRQELVVLNADFLEREREEKKKKKPSTNVHFIRKNETYSLLSHGLNISFVETPRAQYMTATTLTMERQNCPMSKSFIVYEVHFKLSAVPFMLYAMLFS